MTSVWPALWPPWKRTTISACSDNQSTILPFPSSPHWAPTTTTFPISQLFPLQLSLFRHDLFEKSGLSPLDQGVPGPTACEAHNRIKDAGYRRKQEGAFGSLKKAYQPIDIPQKYAAPQSRLRRRPQAFFLLRQG